MIRAHRSILLPAMVLLAGLGCHQAEPESVKALSWVESADPIADGKVAIAKGDFKLKGVYGLTLSIPGTDRSRSEEYRQKYGVAPIEGTSDVLESEEHGRLVQSAIKYAEAYNRQILSAPNPIVASPK